MSDSTASKMRMGIASPPDREKLVAELFYDDEQWAEIHQESEQLTLQLYPRRDGQPWEFSFDEAVTHEYLAYDQFFGLARKCTWALADIGTPEARARLVQLAGSENPLLASYAKKRLDRWDDERNRKRG